LATEYEDETIDILFQIQVASRKDLADIMRGIKAMGNVEKVSRSLH
jgi:(p)ppGpp synthase/HD superfamily hydrolase